MTLTRELRTGIAFTLAMFLVLTAFVLGNQRQVHADTSLADQILCWIDTTQGVHPPVPYFNVGDCDGGPVVPPPPQCFDGIDNDSDGKTDYGVPGDPNRDPGCDTPTDNTESPDPVVPPAAQCSNGSDDDGDGLIDYPADPGCTDANDTTESPNPTDTGPACSDGADNDQDGKIDMQDPGCSSPSDDDETDGGGNGSPACSDSQDNDQDGLVDYPADPGCTDASDSDETDGQGGSNDDDGDSSGGSSHHRRSSGGSSSNVGEVLGAQTECPMYLTSYIRQGANNDLGEVARLQVFLNTYEANMLAVTGIYDAPTLAAVHAFQRKYSSDVLAPWGLTGTTGYVYYTTQKQINTIYCKFQKEFPLSAAQLQEIAGVRTIQPAVRAQGAAGTTAGAAAAKATVPAVGSVVLPQTTADENATETPAGQSQTAAGANAPTQGWFTRFVNWLFGR